MTNDDNVVQIEPKKTTLVYRRHRIIVQYIPDHATWKWSFTYTKTVPFSNVASSQTRAIADAKELIDKLEGT